MHTFANKLSDIKLLFDSLDEPPPSISYQQLTDYFVWIWNVFKWYLNIKIIEYHPISIIYVVSFLLYAYYASKSILTVLTLSIIIFKSINESMSLHRYAQLKYSMYDIIKILSQLFGDILTMPYHLIFNHSETPYIYFKPTIKNKLLFSTLQPIFTQYFPTFYLKNALMQFLLICLEETPFTWYFKKSTFHIKRECITLSDQGLIALDWWVNPNLINSKNNSQHFIKCTYSDKINCIHYKSKIYYKYTHKLYNQCFNNQSFYPKGDATPILLVFPTFAGDSVSSPTRRICKYYVEGGWRVIVYVKRGCGSFTKAEFLPLTTLKPFCLNGEKDYDIIINIIQKRFPFAPKMLMGLSGGGAYIQTILSKKKYEGIFCGGIKIDAGIDFGIECKDMDIRQPFIAHIIGQFFDINVLKCKENKLKYNILKKDKYFNNIKWNEILNYDSYNNGLKSLEWSLKYFVCPCYGFNNNLKEYLKWCKPYDLKYINAPFLILDSLNDFMRNQKHIQTNCSDKNDNIIHIINERGAHCIRREGLFANKCWLSKVSFAFSDFIVRQHK
eukprot:167572_1